MKRSLRRRQYNLPVRVGIRECRAPSIRAKATESTEDLEMRVLKDSSAYGARNVSRVAAGTGEALPGPVTRGDVVIGSDVPYNRYSGKWVACRVGVGGGNSTD
jgi:hypothetical protein